MGGHGSVGVVFGKFTFEFEAFRVRVLGSQGGVFSGDFPRGVCGHTWKFLTVILMKLCKHIFTYIQPLKEWRKPKGGGVAIKGGCSPAADSLALGVGYSLHMWVNHMHFEVLQATNALPRSNFGYLISAPHEHTQLQVCWHTQLKLTCPQTFCVWGRKLG